MLVSAVITSLMFLSFCLKVHLCISCNLCFLQSLTLQSTVIFLEVELWDLVEEYGITQMTIAPSKLASLMSKSSDKELSPKPDKLKFLGSGNSKLN